MIDNCIDDWIIAIDKQRVLEITLEVIICLVHPLPGDFRIEILTISSKNREPRLSLCERFVFDNIT